MRLSSWCVDVVVAYQSTTASSFKISSYISWRLTTFINQWCNSVTLDVDFIYYLFMNASKCCDLVHHQQKYLWYCDSKLYILFHLVSVSVFKLFRDFVRKKFEMNRARFSKQNTSSWSGNILVRIYTSYLHFKLNISYN